MSKPVTGAQAHIDLLGFRVRDCVTGLEGVITSICFDLYGCIQAAVQPGLDKDGKPASGIWFDVNRLTALSPQRVMPVPGFDKPPKFGATPATHTHGPAEKPARP